MNKTYCLIDIGTNNVLLLLAEIQADGFRVLKRLNRISALGAGMKAGILQSDGIFRTQKILEEYIQIAHDHNTCPVLIGTSALREAENNYILRKWLSENYDLYLNLITGSEEARLNGLANINEFKDAELLLFDIGGGSTEFTLIKNKKISSCVSIGLGIRKMYNEFSDDACHQTEYIRNLLNSLTIKIPPSAILIGIGGTVTTLAALLQRIVLYDESSVHKYKILASQLDILLDRIQDSPENEIIDLIPFNPTNKALLLTGGLIVREIIAHFSVLDFFVSNRTWQYGVLSEIITGRYKV